MPTDPRPEGRSASYCGCCGGRCSETSFWCVPCQAHVLPRSSGKDAWDRTWFAQHREACPFDKFKAQVAHDEF